MADASLTDICRKALPLLDPQLALVKKQQHAELYVERGGKELERLYLRLKLDALERKSKLVFSGHIGTGKSTELFHLRRRLEEEKRATILYFSVKDHVDLVGLDTLGLLEGLARAVNQERNGGTVESAFDLRLSKARESVRRSYSAEVRTHAGAGASPSTGFASGEVGASSERVTLVERTDERPPDIRVVLELVNEEISALRERRTGSPPVLLLCDDLEKLDLDTAQGVFSGSLALAAIDACVVFTVPIALIYSQHRALLRHFDEEETVLPLIKVRDRHGAPLEDGIARMRAMVLPRLPELDRVLEPAAFRELALNSGGVLRDLVRMLRQACLEVLTQERPRRLGVGDLRPLLAVVKNSFLRQVPRELYPRLREVHHAADHRGAGMDGALAQLLNLTAVLEYTNDDTWYRVHPLADFLIEGLDAGGP